jgi:hypothetical protein
VDNYPSRPADFLIVQLLIPIPNQPMRTELLSRSYQSIKIELSLSECKSVQVGKADFLLVKLLTVILIPHQPMRTELSLTWAEIYLGRPGWFPIGPIADSSPPSTNGNWVLSLTWVNIYLGRPGWFPIGPISNSHPPSTNGNWALSLTWADIYLGRPGWFPIGPIANSHPPSTNGNWALFHSPEWIPYLSR